MSTESLLDEFLSKSRAARERSEHSAVVKRIEDIFDELKLPWKRDDDCWVITSNVGEVMAGLDDDEEVLSFWSMLFTLSKPAKKSGELYAAMLRANIRTTGACYAIKDDPEGGNPNVLVLGRISSESIDAPEVALTLSSVFALVSMGE